MFVVQTQRRRDGAKNVVARGVVQQVGSIMRAISAMAAFMTYHGIYHLC